MRAKRNRKRERTFHDKAGKHLSAKPKLLSSASAAGPQSAPDLVRHRETDNFTLEAPGADAASPALTVDATASQQAVHALSETFAEPGTRNDGASQAQVETDPAGREMEVHPLAKIFGLPSEDDLRSLADDIKRNGLLEPITTFQGMILDGRCRYLACGIVGVEPKFEEYAGADRIAFVISKNVRRRHLDESQRAMAAAKLSHLPVGGNQFSEGLPIGRAAKLFSVSERSVARAKEVLRLGNSDLVKEVERGKIAISVAAKKCRPAELEHGALEAEQEGARETTAPAQTVLGAGETPKSGGLNEPSPNRVDTELPAIEPVGSPPIAPPKDGADPHGDAFAQRSVNAPNDAAFDTLVAAWAAASEAVRHRFVIEIVQPDMESSFGV
jgi:hypothetical protein